MRVKMSKLPPPAPTASAIGPCPTVIQIVGRPGTGSLPSTIAPPDHPRQCLFFSAEIKAIDLALDHIEQSRNSDFIIFSDSLSVLQSLHNRHIENPLLLDVLLKHNELAELNNIVFVGFRVMLGLKATKKPTSLQNRP